MPEPEYGTLEWHERQQELEREALLGLSTAHETDLADAPKAAQPLEAPAPEITEEKAPRKSQATELGDLVKGNGAELFHDPDSEPFITVLVNGHRETYRLKSKAARAWLRRLYREETGRSVGGQALQDCLNDLEGTALFDGQRHPVYVRLAEHDGDTILDLGDDSHQVVCITPQGWHLMAQSPVRFIRPKALAPLPVPVSGADLGELWALLNVQDDDRVLLAAFLVAALRPHGPYPALALTGEQGSAKSTVARAVRALVDPSTAPLRSAPRDPRDLMIAATSSWVPTFDNLSGISPDLSDALCVLSTGGGYATRTLYADSEETVLSAQRPVILTGISDIVSRSDLLDRSLILYLPRIAEDKRCSESHFWENFTHAHAGILGALLTAVSTGLAKLPNVYLPELPRMADFALWAVACETQLGFEPGSFIYRYGANRAAANELALDTSPLPQVLRVFIGSQLQETWSGTASDLLNALNLFLQNRSDDRTSKLREWPKRADKLSGTLRRYAPNLRATGLEVEFSREPTGAKRKLITLRVVAKSGDTSATGDPDAREKSEARKYGGVASGDAKPTGVATSDTGKSSDTCSDTGEKPSETLQSRTGGASGASGAKKPNPSKALQTPPEVQELHRSWKAGELKGHRLELPGRIYPDLGLALTTYFTRSKLNEGERADLREIAHAVADTKTQMGLR